MIGYIKEQKGVIILTLALVALLRQTGYIELTGY